MSHKKLSTMRTTLPLVVAAALGAVLMFGDNQFSNPPQAVARQLSEVPNDALTESDELAALQQLSQELCSTDDHIYPRLDYEDCDQDGIINVLPFFGGLTNGLKMLLLGALMSYEEGRCFVVDEHRSHLNPTVNGTRPGFLNQFFEPMGLGINHPAYTKAKREGRIKERQWPEYWEKRRLRRVEGTFHTIPALGIHEKIGGKLLKKTFLRRMWRLLPEYREAACHRLHVELGLEDNNFMAFSVRRGDKDTEDVSFTPLERYVEEAESQAVHRFGGSMPKIFVASDDCSVLKEFRTMRPEWNFISECDYVQQSGFVLQDVKKWDQDDKESHFRKFFVELYAMCMSKVLLGVRYTNVSWWVLHIRPFWHSFTLVDKVPTETDFEVFNAW